MIEQLLENILQTFGHPIKNTNDCKSLSDEIFQKTKKYISYNSIRRVFHVVESNHVPRMSTLNILAEYIGFQNFDDFMKFQKESIYLDRLSFSLHSSSFGITQRLDFIRELRFSIVVVSQLSREAIFNENWLQFEKILNWLDKQNYDYESLLYFGNSVGSLFREKEIDIDRVKRNPLFFKFIFSIFVDYSSLKGYYGRLIDYYCDNLEATKENDYVFVCSLKIFKSFLLNENCVEFNYDFHPQSNFHPIVNSRIIATRILLAQNDTEIKTILNDYSRFLSDHIQFQILESFYEILLISLPLKNQIIFKWLENEQLESLTVVKHQNNYLTMWKFVKYYYRSKSESENSFSSNDLLFIRNSYVEFVRYFYLYSKKQSANFDEQDIKMFDFLKQKIKYPYLTKFYTSLACRNFRVT